MGIDDGPADRQPHPNSAGLRGVESLENALEMFRTNARPGIAHCHENATGLGLLGADQQLSGPRLNRAHGFDRVQDQVQDDLLQLNTIPLNGKQPIGKAGLDRNSILGDCASRQYNYLVDRLIEIKTILSWRRFLDVITNPVDYVSSSISIAHDAAERFPDLVQVRRLPVQKIQGRAGVVTCRGNRLLDFVSERGGLLSHYAQTVHVRE